MDKRNKNYSFKVTESKLIYSKQRKVKLFPRIVIIILTIILLIAIMCGINYGFVKLFKLTTGNLDLKISYCSAILTFACALITVSSLLADRQLKIYDDSLVIFNELVSKDVRELSAENTQQNPPQGMSLHRWYFVRNFKTYFLKNKKKLYLQISNAHITFFYDKNIQNPNSSNSLELEIPLTTAEWNFFNVTINYFRMLHYQKYCLFEFYSTTNENGLLMWETVLSLYISVMVNKIMNAIRLISILSIPSVILIACII